VESWDFEVSSDYCRVWFAPDNNCRDTTTINNPNPGSCLRTNPNPNPGTRPRTNPNPGSANKGLEIWSIYNPPDTKAVPAMLLARPQPHVPTILAGDFNLHHPLWDYYGRTDRKADDLLQLALQWELDLRTPYGTITREPQGIQRGRPSIIDHFWASISLETTYQGLAERGKSDHYPQVLEIVNQGPR
jgi:hypothetical protein